MGVLKEIVKANDVRGVFPSQFSPAVSRAFGAAFVDVIGPELVLGHDMRNSAEVLVDAFIDGVLAQGGRVTSIGLCSTDGLYFASGHLDLPGVMFTASHNPAEYNGMKLCYSGARPIGEHTGLRDLAQRAEAYLQGSGEAAAEGEPAPVTERGPDTGAAAKLGATAGTAAEARGSVVTRDLLGEYAAYLRALAPIPAGKRLRVVVDAGNGMAGLTAPAVLGTIMGLPDSGIDLVELYFELDGTFPNHEANPLDLKNLIDLQTAVIAEQADLGLAFDGDADRCFVIDEHGVAIDPSAITTLVGLREVAKELQQGTQPTVVRNLITSQAVQDLLEAAGATVVTTRVGHAYIKEQMAAHDAIFGGEHSAHYYFRDFFYADSGMLAALHVIGALVESGMAASDLSDMYTPHSASGELNFKVAGVEHTLERVVAAFAEDIESGHTRLDRTDGLTLSHWHATPRWWANIRPSNTEPLLRINVEAEDADVMEKIRDNVVRIISQENPS